MRRHPVMSRPAKRICRRRQQAAAEQAHQRGLAGPVRADQRMDAALGEVEVDALHRLQPAEGAGEAARLQQGHGSHGKARARSTPRRPAGREEDEDEEREPDDEEGGVGDPQARSTR